MGASLLALAKSIYYWIYQCTSVALKTCQLSVVKTQGSSNRFLFSYHSAIPKNLFKGYFFTARVDIAVAFSINLLSSSAFLGFPKALEQDAMSSLLVLFVEEKF